MFNTQERIKNLTDLGYTFEYNAEGYLVKFNNNFVSSAGTIYYKNPSMKRSKPKHWKHKQADLKDNFESCILAAERHLKLNEKKYLKSSFVIIST